MYQAHLIHDENIRNEKLLDNLVIISSRIPPGFEAALDEAAQSIAVRQGYSIVSIWSRGKDWESLDFGYIIAFIEPTGTVHTTGYEDFQQRTGYPHSYAYVSRSLLYELVPEYAKGNDIQEILEREILWIWDRVDTEDGRVLESMVGLISSAYHLAASASDWNHEFQQYPERYKVELVVNYNGDIVVTVRDISPNSKDPFSAVQLFYADQDFLTQLTSISGISRGGKIFYHTYKTLLENWNRPDYLPIVSGR